MDARDKSRFAYLAKQHGFHIIKSSPGDGWTRYELQTEDGYTPCKFRKLREVWAWLEGYDQAQRGDNMWRN